jgi:hypothetical protein
VYSENEIFEVVVFVGFTDRNCHFGIFAVLGQNSVFSPNYDFLQPEQLIQSQFFGNADSAKYNPSQFVP